jgi:hypothetical protein
MKKSQAPEPNAASRGFLDAIFPVHRLSVCWPRGSAFTLAEIFMRYLILALVLVVVARAETPTTDTNRLVALIGKDIRAKEAQDFLDSVGATPEISRYEESSFQGKKIPATTYYSYKEKGLSIRLDERGFITTIFFYAEGADGFRQYRGGLPYGISFTMTRTEVEKAIGRASRYDGSGRFNFWASYPAKKMSLTYDSVSQTDMGVRIQTVRLTSKP